MSLETVPDVLALNTPFTNEAPAFGNVPTEAVTPFINEIHYDNDGIDTGEAVEIAAPAGTDLTGWTLLSYNGATGEVFRTDSVPSGVVQDQGNGLGTVVVDYPLNGLQNDLDGVALVDSNGNVVQFLSWEGTFTAVNGAASGLTSADIGVAQDGNTLPGSSLQLTDNGFVAFDTSTFGVENTGQDFTGRVSVVNYSPVGPAVTLDADITISGIDTYGGATLNLSPATNGHRFGINGTPVSYQDPIVVNGITIGEVGMNTAGGQSFQFSSDATNELVNQFLQSLTYDYTGTTPPANVEVTWSFEDGNTAENVTAVGVTTVVFAEQASPIDLSSGCLLYTSPSPRD